MFTTIKNVYGEVEREITESELIHLIQNNPQKEIINQLRNTEYKSDEYNRLKPTLSGLTPHGIFSKVENKSLISLSGYLFYDIDGLSDISLIKEHLISNDLCNIVWLSPGGRGLHMLLKVEGLSEDNFGDNYNHFFNLINDSLINNFNIGLDNQASGLARKMFLSYDKDLRYKNTQFVVTIINRIHLDSEVRVFDIEDKYDLFDNVPTIKDDEENYKMRFTDADDYCPVDKDYRRFSDGVMVHKIKVPNKRIMNGSRNSFLSMTCRRLIMLNPDIPYTFLKKYMEGINNNCLINPVDNINTICKQCFKNRQDVLPNHRRVLIYNPNTTLDKKKTTPKLIGELRTLKTKQEIYNCIEDWDFDKLGKITQEKVSKETGKGIRTIQKHWSDYKDYVKELNK
jgi:hypothetical protein